MLACRYGRLPGKSIVNLPTLTDIDALPGSLAQRVYHVLRGAILDMTFPPGEIIRKTALCEQLGVSRSPVSDAIARLASEGLLDVVPQSGTRVSRLSMEEIREETFLREAIEVAAAMRVAKIRTEEQLTRLTRNLRLQELLVEDRDFMGLFEADEDFHALTLEFTGFPKAAAVVGTLSLQIKRARILLLPEEGRAAETVAEHAIILDAFRRGDPDAARKAMSFHLGQLIPRIEPLERRHPEFFRSR